MKPAHHTPRRRPGFTLVELLVVISLIAILLTLSASATVRVIEVQRKSNSEQIVKIVAEALDRANVAVVAESNKSNEIPSTIIALAGGEHQRARVLWIKFNQKQEFPMTFLEAIAKYGRELAGVTPVNPPAEIQASICLLLALQRSRGGVQFNPDILGPHAVVDSPCTVNGKPLKMIVDGWANPVVFFRWPTGYPEINPGGPAAGFNDPADPTGWLCRGTWNDGWFRTDLHALPRLGSRPQSYRVPLVVVSAGRDKLFGLNFSAPPRDMSIANQSLENDNISSHRLRFGARGD